MIEKLPKTEEVYYAVWGNDGHLHVVETTPEVEKAFEKQLGRLKDDKPFKPECYAWVRNRNK